MCIGQSHPKGAMVIVHINLTQFPCDVLTAAPFETFQSVTKERESANRKAER